MQIRVRAAKAVKRKEIRLGERKERRENEVKSAARFIKGDYDILFFSSSLSLGTDLSKPRSDQKAAI